MRPLPDLSRGRHRRLPSRQLRPCRGGAYGYVDMGGWIGGQADYVMVPYADCESASNLDPWRNRYNALQSNDFREKEGVTVGRRSNTPEISNSASASTIW